MVVENKVRYNWATLGTGVIANELAQALEKSGGNLYSVANRTYAKGVDFAQKYGIEKVYDKIDDVFSDDNVDIIYISTPHNTHIDFLRKVIYFFDLIYTHNIPYIFFLYLINLFLQQYYMLFL